MLCLVGTKARLEQCLLFNFLGFLALTAMEELAAPAALDLEVNYSKTADLVEDKASLEQTPYSESETLFLGPLEVSETFPFLGE